MKLTYIAKTVTTLVVFCFGMLQLFAQDNPSGSKGVLIEESEGKKLPYKNVHALVIGVAEYTEVNELNYTDDDARKMHDALSMIFPDQKENFVLLVDEEATSNNIIMQFEMLAANVSEDDLVLFYFSGHGDIYVDAFKNEHGFFLAYDVSASRNYMGSLGVVPFNTVNYYLSQFTSTIGANVVMIADACRSGEINNTKEGDPMFSALSKSGGSATKIVSCKPEERSWEVPQLEQGVFTYYLLKAISGQADTENEDDMISQYELNTYLRSKVSSFMKEYNGAKQYPKVTGPDDDFVLFKTLPGVADLLKDDSSIEANDLASNDKGAKGISSGYEPSSIFLQFKSELKDGNLRNGGASALMIYEEAKSMEDINPKELGNMERLLINALLHRVQSNTTKFLSGSTTISNRLNFDFISRDLEIVYGLMRTEHPLRNNVKLQMDFFAAMNFAYDSNNFDPDRAKKELIALSESNPNVAYLNQGLALVYLKMNQTEKANEQLQMAQGKVSTWNKPINTTAAIYIEGGKLDEAKTVLNESSQLKNNSDYTHILKSQLYSSNLELQTAEAELEYLKTSKVIPEAEYHFFLGKINEKKGRIVVAENNYLTSIKLEKNNTQAIIQLANLYKNDGDTTNAIRYYEKALSIQPNNTIANNSLAQLTNKELSSSKKKYYSRNETLAIVDYKLSKNDAEGAIDFLKSVLKSSNDDPELHYAIGKAYYANRDNSNAIKSLKTAIELSPYHFESIQSLTYLYILEGKFSEAKALMDSHDSKFQNSAKWHVFVYEANRKMKKTENLIFRLEEAIKLDSTDTEAYKSLYRLHMSSGNYSQAEDQFIKLRELGGRDKDSTAFLFELINSVNTRIENGKKDNKAVDGLNLILSYDKRYLNRMYSNARKNYFELNYRVADIYLDSYGKYLFAMRGTELEYDYYRLKAYLLLEVGLPRDAMNFFEQVCRYSKRECYAGYAMAKYELGHPEQGWMTYFKKGKDLKDLNSVAMERYRKMSRNSGYYTPGGRR
jgi:tetratricopeptide (TPR) repeat protein